MGEGGGAGDEQTGGEVLGGGRDMEQCGGNLMANSSRLIPVEHPEVHTSGRMGEKQTSK